MVMVCESDTSLPHESVQVHVRTIVRGHVPLSVSLKTGVMSPSQLSVHVTAAGASTSESHCPVASPGTPESTGSSLSVTVTSNVQEAVWPASVVATQVTVVVSGQAAGKSPHHCPPVPSVTTTGPLAVAAVQAVSTPPQALLSVGVKQWRAVQRP